MTSARSRASPIPICSATTLPLLGCLTPTSSPACARARRAMAQVVGIFAASNGPLIARDWARLPAALKGRLSTAYGKLGRRIAAAEVDVIIGLAPDHWTNFFLDNLPALCIGVGDEDGGLPG